MIRGLVAASAVAALVCFAPSASANGRFPNAVQLVVSPSDPKHFLLPTTYGLVHSFDGGATWAWSCERSVGYSGVFDPAFAISGNGQILAGLLDGLARSTDRACDWSRAPEFAGKYVIDLAIDAKNPLRVVGLTAGNESAAGTVIESLDGGTSWKTVIELDKDLRPETLDVAPSDSQRLYVSGAVAGDRTQGFLLRSDDAGRTFKRSNVELRGGVAPFIAAVDRANADRVYLRINVDAVTGGDHLVATMDGGATFQSVATATGDLLGVALSPDGRSLAFGGPRDGISIASVSDWSTRRVSSLAARCLAWRPEGMYVCIPEGPFTVGLSTDEGATFQRFYSVTKVTELKCAPSTTTGEHCPAEWPGIYSMTDSDIDAGTDSGVTPAAPTAPASDGGCGCATYGRSTSYAAWFAIAIAAIARLRYLGRTRGCPASPSRWCPSRTRSIISATERAATRTSS